MKKYLVYGLAGLLLATSAWAAEDEMGTIVSADPAENTFTIRTDDGDRIVYRSSTSTQMMRDGSTVRMGDLAVGTRVEVTAPEAEGSQPRMASRVQVVAADDMDERTGTGDRMRQGIETDAARRAREAREGTARSDFDETDNRMARADRLPRTAGFLPLLGLLGAAGVVTGLLFRRMRR